MSPSLELFDASGESVDPGDPGALAELFAYTGKLFDADTQLQYNWTRWYDAAVGKWLSEDAIWDGVNLTRYVGNSPLTYTDPLGLSQQFGPSTRDDNLISSGNRLAIELVGKRIYGRFGGEGLYDGITFITEIIFDVFGIFDPTPMSDSIAAGMAASRGDEFGAAASAAGGWLPFFGDSGKIWKWGRKFRHWFRGGEAAAEGAKDFKKGERAADAAADAARAGKQAPGRSFDDIINNDNIFRKWIRHKFPAGNPLTPSQSRRVWNELKGKGVNPVWSPGHPVTKWPGPHINVPGTNIHIPVDPNFKP